MEWFGITMYGVSNPIQDFFKPDYKEPIVMENLTEKYKSSEITAGDTDKKLKNALPESPADSFSDVVRTIDVYIGQADGYAYKSYDRLIKMRKKGIFKPVGPAQMYKYPCCTSIEIGWYFHDDALKEETWYKPCNKYS